ncbi:polysaccharide deacetylase family protein [bacterium]|nr:polysaccharide deacetylase family protein [bacterium]
MKIPWIYPIFPVIMVIAGCSDNNNPVTHENYFEKPVFEVSVLKWYKGKTAAVSINYDSPWGRNKDVDSIDDEVLSRGLRMDHELVTSSYEKYPEIVARMRDEAIPRGTHFYGHGHTHVLHDDYDYEFCYTSFKTCYDLMKEWGLHPRAYAYPGSSAYKVTTQLANKQAGFICARGAELDRNLIYICPDDVREPTNWQYLPSLVVGQNYSYYVQNHDEMGPLLMTCLDKKAWLIIMYHALGFPDSWGYYPREEFIKDIDLIAASDFWSGNTDMVACYIQERNAFYVDIDDVDVSKSILTYKVKFCDGLDNGIYDQPLTLELTFDHGVQAETVHIEPAIEGVTDFTVADNKIRIDVLPNEKPYFISIPLRGDAWTAIKK